MPALYKHIHKIHHEIKAPFGICAIYFHPVEHVQTAVQSIAPALVLGSHISLLILWVMLATFSIVHHHSGYDLQPWVLDSLPPWKSMTHQHDYHHYAYNKCFGVIGVLDWLHGTDMGFLGHLDEWGANRKASAKRADATMEDSREKKVNSALPIVSELNESTGKVGARNRAESPAIRATGKD